MNIEHFINFKNKWHLVLLDGLILFFWGFVLLFLSNLYKKGTSNLDFIINSPEPLRVIAFFLVVVLLYLFTKTLLKYLHEIGKKNKTYKLSSRDWPNEWIFNGMPSFISNTSGLNVESSRAGILLKKYLWKDFKMTFRMSFGNQLYHNIAIIFRASDLDNYFALEIIERDITMVQPLVRYQGAWETSIWKEVGVLDWTKPVKVKLEVKDDLATLEMDDLIFEWYLPTHVDVNHVEAGSKKIDQLDKDNGASIAKSVPEVPFRRNTGMIGFRAHMNQGAIIRNLKVIPLI